MSFDRRHFIKLAGLGMSGLLLSPQDALASGGTEAENAMAMLYDTKRCIGCRACQNACKDWNGNDVEPDPAGLYDAPMELSADTWTIIELHQGDGERSFVKHQCMHCLEPACASVCPVSALEKTPEGPVVYHANRCIGCRYCMMACPFRVPKYNWENPLPLIKKCTFCAERQAAGLEPACVEACPTDAIVFGRRDELIAEAHRRIQAEPEKYVDHVYGEHEAAGTSALYLSHVPFEKLGFPTLDAQPITARSEAIMSLAPAIFGGAVVLASGIYWLTGRRAKMDAPGEEGE